MKSHSILLLVVVMATVSLSAFSQPAFNCVFSKEENKMEVSLEKALEMALKQNLALKIEKIDAEVSKTYIESEKARFDTNVRAELSGSERIAQVIYQQGDRGDNVANRTDFGITMSRINHSGSLTELEVSTSRTRSAQTDNFFSTRIGINFEHPLKRGAGKEVNLVSLRQAELDLSWSYYELQGFVLNLIAEIETRYWEYYLSTRRLEIMQESVRLAEQQYEETLRRIDVGSIPESEAAAAEAEVMLRKVDLINAESTASLAAVALLRIINPDTENFYKKRPVIVEPLFEIDLKPEGLEPLIKYALAERPEIQQADLLIQRQQLEVISTRNGLLPRLDFFARMGKTGYATSLSATNPKPGEKGSYDISAGFVYDLTRNRRDERARHQRATLNVKLRQQAMDNLEQLIKQEVINAWIEVNRTMQQIKATAATSEKQREKLRVEEVKFNVGKTTSFQVAQAQRDMTEARIAEVSSAIEHQQAYTELLRATGVLLNQRNIVLDSIKNH
jgi:outer membrane protein TolC